MRECVRVVNAGKGGGGRAKAGGIGVVNVVKGEPEMAEAKVS